MKLRACRLRNPVGGSHAHHLAPESQQACHFVPLNTLFLWFWLCSPKSTHTAFPQPYKYLSLKTIHVENMFFSLRTTDMQNNKDFKCRLLFLASFLIWKRQERAGDLQLFVTTKQKSAKSSTCWLWELPSTGKFRSCQNNTQAWQLWAACQEERKA